MKSYEIRRLVAAGIGVLVLSCAGVVWSVVREPSIPAPDSGVVNDVTQLNPVTVDEILTPTTTEEIIEAVRRHPGPVAIGGGRFSMGGQTATEGALHIDMRTFNRILAFDPAAKTITVQAGARWRDIQEHIDSAGLSVMIMQTYADFTVGGSISVNAHGRYVGLGPLVGSVLSIRIVLADGTHITASPTARPDVFYAAVGGYGAIGVITEATLRLTDNIRVKRTNRVMPISQYAQFFRDSVRGTKAVFHNADIYPMGFTTVNAVTYTATDDPVTVPERLIPATKSYAMNRFVFWVIAEWPLGKFIRRQLIDRLLFRDEPVSWRNHEASYTVAELEPASRRGDTYVLQEYFVPVDSFDAFATRMRDILRRGRVNVINVSIRHANRDPGTLMAWARSDVFAFVLYYQQATTAAAQVHVGDWTRELIEAALSVGGTYYLPYQLLATSDQFRRAYPRAPDFFALKQKVDPTNKFRNRLWDRYYCALPSVTCGATKPGSSALTP